jgi:hypothetical protein
MDLLVTFFGIMYAWRRNGREAGTGFFDRYFSIGWVVQFRTFVIVRVLFAVLMHVPGFQQLSDLFEGAGGFASAFASSDDEPAETGPGAFALVISTLVSIYVVWSIGRNIGRVREETERRGGAPVPMTPAPAVTASAAMMSAPAGRLSALEPSTPRSVTGMDRFVESVVQRELSQGSLGGRPRRRSTIRPLKSSRRAAPRRKPSRKPVRRRKSSRRR